MDLIFFLFLYLAASVAIGLYVARRVHTTKDFAVAGRHLPLPIVTATVFATWFGSEAVFGSSGAFVKEGVSGILADPFGAGLCLIIAGIFFSAHLYKLNVLTLGDYYRSRYGRTVEILATVCIILSYLGWVSAQVKALGGIIEILSRGEISPTWGVFLGAAVVLTYTTVGGMLSVAILDFIQMVIVIVGLGYIASIVAGMTGGVETVIQHARMTGKFDLFPRDAGPREWLLFVAPFVTMMLGSIPQQDVFQRITSAKSARTALYGSLIGGSFYILFCAVPILTAYGITLISPNFFNADKVDDAEKLISIFVRDRLPLFAQIFFFGAVISAIMSTASATLLAPSVAFSENILRNFMPHLTERGLLRGMRISTVCFAIVVFSFALNTESSIYEMVESAYAVTLAGAFVPLIAGPLWKGATNQGALFSVVGGVCAWILTDHMFGEEYGPPQLIGLAVSFVGLVAGSSLPQWIPDQPAHARAANAQS
ncbi:MAG: sodium:solute symporter family protein [Zoogloeaceae bacterium]|jgi:Na+/proline symporter|nr:sodium:solute symporter family protein [Zoogloeaceae bacterium]